MKHAEEHALAYHGTVAICTEPGCSTAVDCSTTATILRDYGMDTPVTPDAAEPAKPKKKGK